MNQNDIIIYICHKNFFFSKQQKFLNELNDFYKEFSSIGFGSFSYVGIFLGLWFIRIYGFKSKYDFFWPQNFHTRHDGFLDDINSRYFRQKPEIQDFRIDPVLETNIFIEFFFKFSCREENSRSCTHYNINICRYICY